MLDFFSGGSSESMIICFLDYKTKSQALRINHAIYFYLFNFRRIKSNRIPFTCKPATMWFVRAPEKNAGKRFTLSMRGDVAGIVVNTQQCFVYIASHRIGSFRFALSWILIKFKYLLITFQLTACKSAIFCQHFKQSLGLLDGSPARSISLKWFFSILEYSPTWAKNVLCETNWS